MAPGAAWAADAAVTGVRLGVNNGKTRVVLDLTKPVPYSAFLLANPYRLVIDLPEVGWSVNGGAAAGKRGVVDRLRYGHFRPGNSRVVVDLNRPVTIVTHNVLSKPHRVMFDLAPVKKASFKPSVKVGLKGWAPPQAARIPLPSTKPGNVDGRRVVVIDAGHGGVDPGAVRGKIYEKRITLAVAQAVRTHLQNSGRYRVVLTRSRDTFLELRERVDVSRVSEGDIFISLHADTHPKSKTRGASVYALSERASDKEAAALAAKENKSNILAGFDLSPYSDETSGILLELRQRRTMEDSAIFAEMLIRQFGKKKVRTLLNKHRSAGFVVLKSPDVPSVLVELGYLSNKYDRKMLLQPSFRAKVANAMLAALDRYFKEDQARK